MSAAFATAANGEYSTILDSLDGGNLFSMWGGSSSRSGTSKYFKISEEEAKKLAIGTLLEWPEDVPGFSAKAGAMAKVVGPYDGNYWTVEWVRNGHDHGQHNGPYTLEGFKVFISRTATTTTGSSQMLKACDCSKSDFAKYGCRYLKKPDSTNTIHF